MAPSKFRKTKEQKKSRKKGFRGVQKQFLRNSTSEETTDGVRPRSSTAAAVNLVSADNLTTATDRKLLNSSFTEDLQDIRYVTREKAKTEGLGPVKKTKTANGCAIIDLACLENFFNDAVACKICLKKKATFTLFSDEEKRDGLSLKLSLKCSSCLNVVSFNTSKKIKEGAFEVNRRSVLAVNTLKGGRKSLASFCGMMNMPPPVTNNAYNKHLKISALAAVKEAENLMIDAANRLLNLMLRGDPKIADDDEDNAVPVAVSVDGSWQKRGYSSKFGVVFVIGVLTGEILDYEVLSLFCKECSVHEKSEKDSEQFLQWKEKHKQHCSINFEGSS